MSNPRSTPPAMTPAEIAKRKHRARIFLIVASLILAAALDLFAWNAGFTAVMSTPKDTNMEDKKQI